MLGVSPIREWDFMDWVMSLLVLAVIGGVLFIPVAIYLESQRPTFELAKEDWVCTDYKTYTTFVMSGKVMVPVYHKDCTQWTEKQ